MTDNRHVAGRILDLSKAAVTTVRGAQHGDAETSFAAIGQMWTAYLNALSIRQTGLPLPGLAIMPRDVAYMMGHVKEMRVMHGDEQNADHYVDQAGYTALAGMFHVPERTVAPASGKVPAAPEQPLPAFLTAKGGSGDQLEAAVVYSFPVKGGTRIVTVDRDYVESLPVIGEHEIIKGRVNKDVWYIELFGPDEPVWPDIEALQVTERVTDQYGMTKALILRKAK